ncbi:MAG: N-acetyl sugar amidotransferase [Dinoroseobacter sp.]|nr:N-acetyl sugar amidotransferase [Dinoroseobacter sp.]
MRPPAYPARRDINLDDFAPNQTPHKALYGLPNEISFCSSCVISNQRPNSAVETAHTKDSLKKTIAFDKHGVCDACRTTKRKNDEVDWDAREEELRELCDRYRKNDGSYDCLVPGSGGKDSFFQAHILKYKYGMHPLTVTWAPHIFTEWGWRNLQRWIHAGFDNYLVTPNGKAHRLLTRLAVENLFHPFQPFILGQKQIGPQMAQKLGIELVFYGENEAEYGNPIEDNESSIRSFKYYSSTDKSSVFLGGTSVQSLVDDFGMDQVDLDLYLPNDPQLLIESGVQVHYLGYYLKWHPQAAYYYAHEHGGFEAAPERTPGTYSKYNSIDDKIDDFHYYTTHIKFGIGRATYDASQEVRSGDIDRDEGVALVRRFDGEFPDRFADEIFEYLSIPETEYPVASEMFEQPIMDRSYFDNLADSFRSPHLWTHDDGKWRLRKTVFDGS